MSWPPAVTVPLLGLTMPQMMLISVVLPAPLGPSSAKISPRSISRSIDFSAWKPDAYVLDRSLTEMTGCMGVRPLKELAEGGSGWRSRLCRGVASLLPAAPRGMIVGDEAAPFLAALRGLRSKDARAVAKPTVLITPPETF